MTNRFAHVHLNARRNQNLRSAGPGPQAPWVRGWALGPRIRPRGLGPRLGALSPGPGPFFVATSMVKVMDPGSRERYFKRTPGRDPGSPSSSTTLHRQRPVPNASRGAFLPRLRER